MYSFYCKKCGHTFESEDKEKVQEYRKTKHPKRVTIMPGMVIMDCGLDTTARGTLARPFLAELIDATIAKEKAEKIAEEAAAKLVIED